VSISIAFSSVEALSAPSNIAGAVPIRILLSESGQLPYEENASARMLSFFNVHVIGQLLDVSDSLALEPILLEKAEYLFDRKEYILKLRDGIRFHNGRLANAKDLEFTILRGFFSKNRSFYKTYIGGIEGIESAEVGNFKSGAVKGVRIIDDLTIGVKLKHQNPSFLHSLTRPYFSLVAREALDDSYLTWKAAPIGAGPYKVVGEEHVKGHVRIEKVASGTPGPQSIDLYTLDVAPRYEFSLVKTSKIDNKSSEFSELAGTIQTLFLSRLNPLGRDENFRRALVHGIDREKLSKVMEGTKPTWEMLPSYFWGRTGAKKAPDLDEAKKFAAKVPRELQSKIWDIVVFNGPEKPHPLYVEVIAQLRSIGFNFKYSRSHEKFTSSKSATESPIFSAGQVTDFIDPLVAFASFLPNGHDPFLTFESDPEFESAFKKAADSLTLDGRIETVKELSRQLSDKVICLPLLERRLPVYYDAKRIKHMKTWSSLGLFKLQDVELAK
jgi:ABC-type transport system substrate-binding protein